MEGGKGGPGRSPAVVLVSGGLDSATCLAVAREAGHQVYALSFDYGQRHGVELDCARRVALSEEVEQHLVLRIDLRAIGGSALTDELEVPDHGEVGEGIPVTYVPARNAIFLSFGIAWAEVLGARDLYVGVSSVDYSGYPDCRPEFIDAFQGMANLATRAGVEGRGFSIHAPLQRLSKAETIVLGTGLGVDYSLTHSCYDPQGGEELACGRCDSCVLRRKGFEEAGVPDPTVYSEG